MTLGKKEAEKMVMNVHVITYAPLLDVQIIQGR